MSALPERSLHELTDTSHQIEASVYGCAPALPRVDPVPAARAAGPLANAPAPWGMSTGKRRFDLVLGGLALVPAAILTAVMATISAAVFRCNPFFNQKRRGLNEEEFSVIKIRSLPKNFAQNCGKHELTGHEMAGWSSFIRRTHLDELPQVLNILDGSMSVVGPRPMIDEVVALLEPQDRQTRATIRPGLTGAWQVSTMGAVALHEHPELDNQYVEKATFLTDVRLMLVTAGTVIGRKPPTPEALSKLLRW